MAMSLHRLLQAESLASIKAFLQNVRLVVNGVFEMTMSGWRVNRPFLRANRKITKPIDRAEPLTLERLGSDSPLNLPEG